MLAKPLNPAEELINSTKKRKLEEKYPFLKIIYIIVNNIL